MFERLQKPFLTVETGEAYQPIRLAYHILQHDKLIAALNNIKCLKSNGEKHWNWLWDEECSDLHFESLDSFKRSADHPVRLATLTIQNNHLYLNLTSFKRACLAVPFFHRQINPSIAAVKKADFINKVFGLSERLPHGLSELFNEDELEKIIHQRIEEYEQVQTQCELAKTADEAFQILSAYTKSEAEKRLPYAERYAFEEASLADADITFLSFYIYLRGRELVAIRRWFGETDYTLADAAEDTIEQVFGGMDIDIIE